MRKTTVFLMLIFLFKVGWCQKEENVCAHYIAHHERLKSIPKNLLGAISKVESGRVNPFNKKIEAWPWTINVQGQGRYFASKSEAVKEVKRLLKQGIKSIDVGCMQINLHHHKDAFDTIDQAFDPKYNVDYAAKFLSTLRGNHGSWGKAVAHYHSALPQHHVPYRKKVLDLWRQANRNGTSDEDTTAYVRGAFWGRERYAKHLPQSKTQERQDPQWRRYETRLVMAQLRARALKNAYEKPYLHTVSSHRQVRAGLIEGDRQTYLKRVAAAKKHRYTKKPILVARKMVGPGDVATSRD